MTALCTKTHSVGKARFLMALSLLALCLSACSINPATGEKQFAGFMPPEEENRVGAAQHPQIIAGFGGEYNNPKIQAYVREIGARVSKQTERPDVKYQFFLLDTPMLNAFAVPGGYIYTTRGVLEAANSESELAAVLAHEVGHITARHSAERYSRDVLTAIGTIAATAAIGNAAASEVIGLGANLYSKSYSRGQESQADDLGIRYLSRSGYDTFAMTGFLSQLEADHKLQQKIAGTGNQESAPSFFATHPNTEKRVVDASNIASKYPKGSSHVGRDRHLRMIDGLLYGESGKQGFSRGQTFYHPELGFTFTVPKGYQIINQPHQVSAVSKNGSVMMLDIDANPAHKNPYEYLTQVWLKDQPEMNPPETLSIHGMRAATTFFNGELNGQLVSIRVLAIQYSPDQIYRFQLAIPQNSTTSVINDLKQSTYSFRRMTSAEKKSIKPQKLKVITARAGDTVTTLSNRMDFDTLKTERFLALNGIKTGEKIISGHKYKIVTAGR